MSASILLLTGIFSGPVAAFLLDYPHVLILLVFPVIGLARLGGRWLGRLLMFCIAPAAFIVYGAVSGNGEITSRAVRWCLAIASGMYFAGELDIPALLERIPASGSRPAGRFLRNLLMVLSLAGPVAGRARQSFTTLRRKGMSLLECIDGTLRGLSETVELKGSPVSRGSPLPLVLAGSVWLLMLWSISGVGGRA
jgi:hypothetical protein